MFPPLIFQINCLKGLWQLLLASFGTLSLDKESIR